MPELKIVSYNINHGFEQKNIVNNVFNFAQTGANIICLQEIRPAKSGKFIGDVLLEKLGADWQAEFFLSDKDFSDYGLAVFWQTAVFRKVTFETVSFSKLKKLEFHEQAFGLIHGSDTSPVQRGGLIGILDWHGKLIRVSNIHLDWHGWALHRAKQLGQMIKKLRSHSRVDAEIICGDLNTLGFFGYGVKFDKIQNELGSDFISAFPKFEYTTTHYQHLDHIFAKNFKINQAEVLQLSGSDHYPIMASLSF